LLGKFDLGLGFTAYNGLTAVVVNLMVATVLSAVWKSNAADQTLAADYEDRVAATT
jgi:solute:Na+ symporter, SSS family